MRAVQLVKWAGFGLALAALAMHQHVVWAAAPFLREAEAVEPKRTLIVLGASVRPNGTPSHMLEDRLATAAGLFARGLAREILVSGDGGGDGYDEVAVMRRELIGRGVPAEAIRVDHAGFRTLETMTRANAQLGVDSAIVVTNPFHVHRAVFLARAAGIDATGVAARGHRYSARTLARHHARECAARGLAWAEAFVLGTAAGRP